MSKDATPTRIMTMSTIVIYSLIVVCRATGAVVTMIQTRDQNSLESQIEALCQEYNLQVAVADVEAMYQRDEDDMDVLLVIPGKRDGHRLEVRAARV